MMNANAACQRISLISFLLWYTYFLSLKQFALVIRNCMLRIWLLKGYKLVPPHKGIWCSKRVWISLYPVDSGVMNAFCFSAWEHNLTTLILLKNMLCWEKKWDFPHKDICGFKMWGLTCPELNMWCHLWCSCFLLKQSSKLLFLMTLGFPFWGELILVCCTFNKQLNQFAS